MMIRTFLTSLLALCATSTVANAAVWETKNQWDASWEAQYQDWVAREWDKDFFFKPGPMKNAVVDCADTVYTMRAYFASLNGLPFVMKDPTTRAAGATVTNEMTRWDSQEPEKRIRSFIRYIHGIGSTATLPNDTYPTAIGRSTLHSGSLIATDRANHHSWTIKLFSQTGIPTLIFGSLPARTALYERNDYPSTAYIFPRGIRPETNAGFRNFRQPMDIGKPVHEVTGYSLEQYSLPHNRWSRAVQREMQQIEETHEQRLVRLLGEACKGAKERVDIVKGAITLHAGIGSRCMNAREYDDQSTPNRDLRMKQTFEDLANSYQEAMNASGLTARTQGLVTAVLTATNGASDPGNCQVEYTPGKTLTLGQVYQLSVGDKLSHNPHDTLEMRWGLQAGPSAKARSCPVY